MTQDEIIRMAREAGMPTNKYGMPTIATGWVERFANLVAEAKDKEIAAKQAEIDRLMWEYCPQEMTLEQVANWEAHQQPWSDKNNTQAVNDKNNLQVVNEQPQGEPVYTTPPSVEAAIEATKEKAAKVCEEKAEFYSAYEENYGHMIGSEMCAAAIRGMK